MVGSIRGVDFGQICPKVRKGRVMAGFRPEKGRTLRNNCSYQKGPGGAKQGSETKGFSGCRETVGMREWEDYRCMCLYGNCGSGGEDITGRIFGGEGADHQKERKKKAAERLKVES